MRERVVVNDHLVPPPPPRRSPEDDVDDDDDEDTTDPADATAAATLALTARAAVADVARMPDVRPERTGKAEGDNDDAG